MIDLKCYSISVVGSVTVLENGFEGTVFRRRSYFGKNLHVC